MSSPALAVRRLVEHAVLPRRAHPGDAGIDLVAAERCELSPGARALVGTGIAVAIPDGWTGLVCPRSGLATRHGISMVNSPGVIDAGYRGEVRVLLHNTDLVEPFVVEPGDRIAQLLLVPVMLAGTVEVDDLGDSERADGGFGSTGVASHASEPRS